MDSEDEEGKQGRGGEEDAYSMFRRWLACTS